MISLSHGNGTRLGPARLAAAGCSTGRAGRPRPAPSQTGGPTRGFGARPVSLLHYSPSPAGAAAEPSRPGTCSLSAGLDTARQYSSSSSSPGGGRSSHPRSESADSDNAVSKKTEIIDEAYPENAGAWTLIDFFRRPVLIFAKSSKTQ